MRYPNPEDARTMSNEDLIEWLAQIAHDAKEEWGWIRDELMRRLGVKDALREAIEEIREHNAEYHHHTPDFMIRDWESLLPEEE